MRHFARKDSITIYRPISRYTSIAIYRSISPFFPLPTPVFRNFLNFRQKKLKNFFPLPENETKLEGAFLNLEKS